MMLVRRRERVLLFFHFAVSAPEPVPHDRLAAVAHLAFDHGQTVY